MEFVDILLYGLWSLVPVFFFGMWLWCTLEKVSGRKIEMNISFLWRQAAFTLICVFITMLLDMCWLRDFEVPFLQEYLPQWFWRVMLFPVVLLVMARIVGSSKQLKISEAPPKVGQGNPRSKGR